MKTGRPVAPDALLRMLGMATRAGAVLTGTERVREAVRNGTLHFVIVAADASENSQDKLLPLLENRQIPFALALDRVALGSAVGKAPLSALGITEINLAKRVQELIGELRPES